MIASNSADILIRGADGELYYFSNEEVLQHRLSNIEAQTTRGNMLPLMSDVNKPTLTYVTNASSKTRFAGGFLVVAGQLKDRKMAAGALVTFMNVGALVSGRKK